MADEGCLPTYTRAGDAGLDLRAAESLDIEPLSWKSVSCGFAVAIPEGHGGFVLPRSGLAANHGITVLNSPGLIDSNYRGDVKVILSNLNPNEAFHIEKGERIAQLVVLKVPEIQMTPVDELDDTNRGVQGFGSSGMQ